MRQTMRRKMRICDDFQKGRRLFRPAPNAKCGAPDSGTGEESSNTLYQAALEQLKTLMDNIPGGIGIYESSPEGIRDLYISGGVQALTGYAEEERMEVCGADGPRTLVFEEDRHILRERVAAMARDGEPINCSYRIHTKSGGFKWVNLRGSVSDRYADRVIFNAVILDVTEQKEAEEKLRLSEELYRLALEHAGCVIMRYDIADRSLNMTPEIAAMFAAGSEKVTDVPCSPVRRGLVSRESVAAFTGFHEDIVCGHENGAASFQVMTVKGWRWLSACFTTVFSETGAPAHAVISFTYITDQRMKEACAVENEQALLRKAERDGKTGLYNKITTEALITGRLSETQGIPCALLVADLDGLKRINDTLGHPEGDRAIMQMAEKLKAQFRRTDIAGRIGGDEFMVFLDGVGTKAQLGTMMESLFSRLAAVRIGKDNDTPLSVSIGIAVGRTGTSTFDELYRQADKALYRAKRGGKNNAVFYSSRMED